MQGIYSPGFAPKLLFTIGFLPQHSATKKYDLSSVSGVMVGAAPTSAELTGQLLALLPNINCMGVLYGYSISHISYPSSDQSSKDTGSQRPRRPCAWALCSRKLEPRDLPDSLYPVFARGCSSPMGRTAGRGNRESWSFIAHRMRWDIPTTNKRGLFRLRVRT